jgi:hypothetical protein
MKTTVEITDALFHRAKQHCADNGTSFRDLIEAGLRATLDPPKPAAPFRLKPFGFKGKGQSISDWSTIRDLAYEGRGGLPKK